MQIAAGAQLEWPANVSFQSLLAATDELSPRAKRQGTAVNIGASDGAAYDETYPLFQSGFHGVAIEADEARFNATLPNNLGPNVSVVWGEAAPHSIGAMLEGGGIMPTADSLDALKLDTDSHDLPILHALGAFGRA